jgi:aminoglycoside 6'-N-acetyltransferase I
MKIQQAELNDLQELATLAGTLWPHHTAAEMADEYRVGMKNPNAAFFLAYEGDTAVGFAQCQLRHDYVEGTESAPVGYLEGIFVAEQYRKQGTAKALLTACENWARTKGCTEFASDCELTNTQSLRFHLNVGFTEANRIICFTKKL